MVTLGTVFLLLYKVGWEDNNFLIIRVKWHKNLFVQFVLKHSKSKMPFLRIHSVKLLGIFLAIRIYVKSISDENVPNLAKKSKFSALITIDFTKILKGRKPYICAL